MLETLVITFREGLEAFLIVAIMLAYLKKTGRHDLVNPVYAGVAVALFISATTGWHVAELAKDPIWEGGLAIAAGVLVASFTLYVMRTAKTIRQDIGNSLESRAQKGGMLAVLGVFIFTVLMIAREGMETALMLGAMTAQQDMMSMTLGAAAGLLSVAVIGYLWASQSHKINLRLFLQVTGIFLVMFSVYLAIYGIHEIHEALEKQEALAAGLPFAEEEGEAGEILGQIASFGLLAVPVLWLASAGLRSRFFPPKEAAQAAE